MCNTTNILVVIVIRHDNQLVASGRCAYTSVLNKICKGDAIEAEGDLDEAQILALVRSEPLNTTDDRATHEHDGYDCWYVERWTHPWPILYHTTSSPDVHQVSKP
jgi:hypothetical protein